jgi:hypothetical protein
MQPAHRCSSVSFGHGFPLDRISIANMARQVTVCNCAFKFHTRNSFAGKFRSMYDG